MNFFVVCLLTASLSLNLPPPNSVEYHSPLPLWIRYYVYLTVVSYLSKCGRFDCVSFHQELSNQFMSVNTWERCTFDIIFVVEKFTVLTQLPLILRVTDHDETWPLFYNFLII
jgi:hypothetical protein